MLTGKHKNIPLTLSGWIVILLLITGVAPEALALSLEQAERVALSDDPAIARLVANATAHEHSAVAADTLPDPQLRLGMFNVPLDDFDIDREPTTQLRVGVQQMFPRGDSNAIQSERMQSMAAAERARADDGRRKLLRDLRIAYLNLYYQDGAARIIDESRKLFASLVKITEDRYGAGRANQQDVVRAELELSRLDDRRARILGLAEESRAELAQWLGSLAEQPLDADFPALPALASTNDVDALITMHPLIRAQQAELEAAGKLTEIAEQEYSPGLNAFVEYRKRFGDNPDGSDRADMMAAMVTMDIPLFTEHRQDRSVAASEQRRAAARYRLDDELRKLKKRLQQQQAVYRTAATRERLYREQLLSAASNNASAALNAYQSGVSEFTGLMRAQITELDVKLDALRVKVDRAISQAELLYVIGEQP